MAPHIDVCRRRRRRLPIAIGDSVVRWIDRVDPQFRVRQADLIRMEPDPKDVEWLLEDLCTTFGFSMAVRDADRFIPLVHQGPDTFADTVLLAEGLDPTSEKRLRRDVREFVAARFERWTSQSAPNQRLNPSAESDDGE